MAIKVGDAVLEFGGDYAPLEAALRGAEAIAQKTFAQLEEGVKRAAQAMVSSAKSVDEYRGELEDANATLERIRKSLDDANRAASAAGDGMGGAGKSVKELEGELKKADAAVTKADKAFQKAKTNALGFMSGVRQLRNEVQQAEARLASAQTRVDSTALALDKAKASGTATTAELNKLQKELQADINEVKKFSGALEAKQRKLAETEAQARKFNQAVKDSSANLTEAKDKLKAVTDSLESAKAGAQVAGRSINELQHEFDEATRAVKLAEAGLESHERAMKQNKAAAESLSAEYRQQTTGLRGLNNALESAQMQLQQNFGAVMDGARNIGMGMTVFGGVTVGALGSAVKAASSFGHEMSMIAGLNVKDLDSISKGIREVAVEFGLELPDAARAAYQALSNEVPEENIIDWLREAATAAIAGQTDLTNAIDYGLTMTSAFGIGVKQSFDEAFTAVIAGRTTFEELNNSVGRLAPTFKAAGLSSKEMLGAIAAMTMKGIDTSEAVSGLKQAISNIIKPTENAASVASALGIEFNASGLQSKGLQGFLADLTQKVEENKDQVHAAAQAFKAEHDQKVQNAKQNKEAIKDMKEQIDATKDVIARKKELGQTVVEEQKNLEFLQEHYRAAGGGLRSMSTEIKELKDKYRELASVSDNTITNMAMMFGSVEALNAVMALGSNSGKDFADKMDRMSNSADAAWESFKRVSAADPELAFKQMKAAVLDLAISIGDTLLPAIKSAVEFLKPIVELISGFVKQHPQISGAILGLVGLAGVFSLIFGPLLMILPSVVMMLTSLGPLLTFLGGAGGFAGLGTAVTGVGASLTAFMVPALAVLGPAGLIAGGIIMLGEVIRQTWEYARATKGATAAHEQADAAVQRQIETLKAQGVAVDELALKEMDANEARLSLIAQMKEAENQKFLEKMQQFQNTSRMTDEEILDLKALSGEQQKSLLAYVASLEKTTQSVDEKSTNARLFLARLSLDHHESPSINDMARSSADTYIGIIDSISARVSPLLDGLRMLWQTTFQGIQDFVVEKFNYILNAGLATLQQIGSLLGMGGGAPVGGVPGAVPGNARGTSGFSGGMTRINERGGEIVNLPNRTVIIPNDVSMALARAAGGGGGNTFNAPLVNIERVNASDPADVDALLRKLGDRIDEAMAQRGARL